jgi:hypothetical protein
MLCLFGPRTIKLKGGRIYQRTIGSLHITSTTFHVPDILIGDASIRSYKTEVVRPPCRTLGKLRFISSLCTPYIVKLRSKNQQPYYFITLSIQR